MMTTCLIVQPIGSYSALDKLLSLKLSSENQRWLYELRFAFDGIHLAGILNVI